MNWLHAVLLGIVEGITEFLPVSSTGHLNIVEKLLGYEINSAGMTAFTAVIQVGAILAAIIYFWADIVRIITAWFKGLNNQQARQDPDYTLGWASSWARSRWRPSGCCSRTSSRDRSAPCG